MIRSTFFVTDITGNAIVLQTFENDSYVTLELYNGETVIENFMNDARLTATGARDLAAKLLKAADRADTA